MGNSHLQNAIVRVDRYRVGVDARQQLESAPIETGAWLKVIVPRIVVLYVCLRLLVALDHEQSFDERQLSVPLIQTLKFRYYIRQAVGFGDFYAEPSSAVSLAWRRAQKIATKAFGEHAVDHLMQGHQLIVPQLVNHLHSFLGSRDQSTRRHLHIFSLVQASVPPKSAVFSSLDCDDHCLRNCCESD